MTKSVEADGALKGAEPLVHQHVPEIQAYGHIIIADSDEGRLDGAAGCEFVDDRIRLVE